VQIRTNRRGSFFISGVHEAIGSLGRVCPRGEQPYVIDHNDAGAEDSGDDASNVVVGTVGTHQRTEVFEVKPHYAHSGFDNLLAEGFKQERFPRREPSGLASGSEHAPRPAGDILNEEGLDDLGRFPTLGAGSEE